MNKPHESATGIPVLGCIADDVTGATDLAINLVQGGMSVVQSMGVPSPSELQQIDADAIVVSLKTRSVSAEHAVEESLSALHVLKEAGISRFFFKYCSTFDSTPEGNIGPVAEALMERLGVSQTVFCPAFPRNGRTVYMGHLFVNRNLLNESGMEQHPLNPMSDANLVRVLRQQSTRKVGLITADIIENGSEKILAELKQLENDGNPLVIVDCCNDNHLKVLAEAVSEFKLLTGGSGIARFLPAAYREHGIHSKATSSSRPLMSSGGQCLILSGSCSKTTVGQVEWMKSRCPSWQIEIPSLMRSDQDLLNEVIDWANDQDSDVPLLVYSTLPAEDAAQLQRQFTGTELSATIERFTAEVAKELVKSRDIQRLIVAGGETAGAVVDKLGIQFLRIGKEIAPGVPWTETVGGRPLALALKSGNFGDIDFFGKAMEMVP